MNPKCICVKQSSLKYLILAMNAKLSAQNESAQALSKLEDKLTTLIGDSRRLVYLFESI